MPTGQELQEDTSWVESQGETVTLLGKDRARGTWYRLDGQAIPNLPVDMYHRTLYRAKGWTLTPPVGASAKAVTAVVLAPTTLEVDGAMVVPGPKIVESPPKHIHVMRGEIGSPCLVLGCAHQRQEPKGEFKTAGKRQLGQKETANGT